LIKWRTEHPESKIQVNKRAKKYRKNHPEIKQRYKDWYQKNKDRLNLKVRHNEYAKKESLKFRLMILHHYGGDIPRCACCGENGIKFLTIDHINGGGNKQRKSFGGVSSYYRWFVKNNFPEGFQVLCMNCNWGKRMNDEICPHKEKTFKEEKL